MYHYIVGGAGLFLGLIVIAALDDMTSAVNKKTQETSDLIRRRNEESVARKNHLRNSYNEKARAELATFKEELHAISDLRSTLLFKALAALEKKLEHAQNSGDCNLLRKQIENLRQHFNNATQS